jgi:hypothetical protein
VCAQAEAGPTTASTSGTIVDPVGQEQQPQQQQQQRKRKPHGMRSGRVWEERLPHKEDGALTKKNLVDHGVSSVAVRWEV